MRLRLAILCLSTAAVAFLPGCMPAPINIAPANLPDATAGRVYEVQLVTDGDQPATYRRIDGSLPEGLRLFATGLIFGVPEETGTFVFTVEVRDADNAIGRNTYMIDVAENDITVTPADLPTAVEGQDYEVTFESDSDVDVTWSITEGVLPAGLQLDPNTGVLSGEPSEAGDFDITITATESAFGDGSREYTLTVLPELVFTPDLPTARVNIAYMHDLTDDLEGGVAPFTFDVLDLPGGLSANDAGVISGTPLFETTRMVEITVTDSGEIEQSITVMAELEVLVTPVAITTTSLPDGTVSAAYSATIATDNGSGNFSFAVTDGVLPGGLMLNTSTGEISGTPTTAETQDFTIRVLDQGTPNDEDTVMLSITINPVP